MIPGDVLGIWALNTSYLVGGLMMLSLLLLYTVFAFMVVRQTTLLNHLLETGAAAAMRLLSLLHLLLALILLSISLFYLATRLP